MSKFMQERIVVSRNNKYQINSELMENEKLKEDDRFKSLFTNKDFMINADKTKKTNTKVEQKEMEEIKEKLNEEAEDSLNNKDKIINPELIQLKEKLLARKRRKIDNLYGKKEETFEDSFQNRLNKEEIDEEPEYDIHKKIERFEVK